MCGGWLSVAAARIALPNISGDPTAKATQCKVAGAMWLALGEALPSDKQTWQWKISYNQLHLYKWENNLSINAGLFHCHAWLPEGPIRFVLVWLVLGDVWPSIAIKSLEVQYSHPTNKIQQISFVSIFNHNYCSYNTYHITHTHMHTYKYIHSIFVLFCFAARCLLLDPRETDRNHRAITTWKLLQKPSLWKI